MTKFPDSATRLWGMSSRSSASATMLSGHVFAKFRKSAWGCLLEVPFPQLRSRGHVFVKFLEKFHSSKTPLGVCFSEVPLPQLHSLGHVFENFGFWNTALGIM